MANSLQVNTNNVVAGLGTFSWTVPGVPGVAEVTDITAVADVAGSLNSTYFTLNAAKDSVAYYVWYNINSAGVDPAVSGKTGIQVAAATGASANTIATATRAALGANSNFVITGATSHIIVTNVNSGATTNAANGAASPGFSFSITTDGVTGSPVNLYLALQVQSTIPCDPGSNLFSSQISPQASAVAIALKKNSTTLVSVGGSATNPTPNQPSIGISTQVLCDAGDSVSVVLSSANAIDNQPNTVKSVINLFQEQ